MTVYGCYWLLALAEGAAFVAPRPKCRSPAVPTHRLDAPNMSLGRKEAHLESASPVGDEALSGEVRPPQAWRRHRLRPTPERSTRRSLLSLGLGALTLPALPRNSRADFAPGGTLLDREVSVTYGNPEASPSRRSDNSNVLFSQDNYYKFGAAARWIAPGSTEFPEKMPFVLSQQRYDALKKYGDRVRVCAGAIGALRDAKSAADVPGKDDPSYQLRALGLMANSFLGSENTGTTNELMLARWYINEMFLRIGDYRDALDGENAMGAETAYLCLVKALNSYLTLMNRQITSKVGEPFGYL